jgi:hypothetical protein
VRTEGEIFSIWSDDSRMYQAGNVYEGVIGPGGSESGFIAFKQGTNAGGEAKAMPTAEICLVREPFDVAPVATQSAADAYPIVLQKAGAVLPRRDAVDLRIIADVENRSGKFINSQEEVGGWPELKSTVPPKDADGDGMPDEWEASHGLDTRDAADGSAIGEDGYSNLERYLNSLVK